MIVGTDKFLHYSLYNFISFFLCSSLSLLLPVSLSLSLSLSPSPSLPHYLSLFLLFLTVSHLCPCIFCFIFCLDTVFRMPFVSRLWNMRQAVQKGYEALYTLQVSFCLTLYCPVLPCHVMSYPLLYCSLIAFMPHPAGISYPICPMVCDAVSGRSR